MWNDHCQNYLSRIYCCHLCWNNSSHDAFCRWNRELGKFYYCFVYIYLCGLCNRFNSRRYRHIFFFLGELIILCLIQIGGLGYMTTSTFLILLIGKKFDFRQKIAISESFDRPFLQGSRNLVISIFVTTFILEIIATIVLYSIFLKIMVGNKVYG